MALRTSDDDSLLNPGQAHSDELFDGSKKSTKEESNDLKNAEEKPNSDWINKVSDGKKNTKTNNKFSFVKKKAPLMTIIITLIGGGFGIAGLLSPALLVVNLKELMVDKFNVKQLTSMDIRTNKIIKSKTIKGALCTGALNIKCKYSSMSKYQVDRFEKAGIKVIADKNGIGRYNPTSFEFDGKSLAAIDIKPELIKNTKFRVAMKKAYNPKFAGFADTFWNKTMLKLGISKKGIDFDGITDKDKLTEIQNETKNPGSISDGPKPGDYSDDDIGKQKYADDLAKFTEDMKNNNLAGLADELTEGITDATKAVTNLSKTAVLDSAANFVKITGPMDNACLAYGTLRAVGFAAKTVRSAQLAVYAFTFLKMADQIKAGANPDPDDVAYLGKVLTTETIEKSATGEIISKKSATDSFGYKYAAYNEIGEMPISASQFLTGAGLTGSLIGITSYINRLLDDKPNSTCKFLNNIFVQIGSFAIGVAAIGFNAPVTITGKIVFSTIGAGAVMMAISYLPALLKDVIAGKLIDESTVGELAGDAITSGSSAMMGTVASLGGNAPLTPAQAVAYVNLSNTIAAQYAEEDKLTTSQFDASDSNSFVGKIVTQLMPYQSKMSSMSGLILSLPNILSKSLASVISPNTKALSTSDYEMCEDIDYRTMNLATDPYCNIMYGIPPDSLEIEPLDVISTLLEVKKQIGVDSNKVPIMQTIPQIDEITGAPIDKYADFVTTCINRATPLGYSGENFQQPAGYECLFGENYIISEKTDFYPEVVINNKYFYLNYIDQRIQNGIDGEDQYLIAAEENNSDANISFYDKGELSNNIANSPNSLLDNLKSFFGFPKLNTNSEYNL